MMVGINKPDQGEIFLGGKNPYLPSTRKEIGFMPEEPHFYDQLTGFEFIKFASDFWIINLNSLIQGSF